MGKKEIYQEKIKAELEKVSDNIYQLNARAKKVNVEDEIELYKQVEKLKAVRDLIGLELQELKDIEEDTREFLEERIQNSIHDLKKTLELAVSRFK
jgi:ribosomal protein L7/L12